MQTVRNLIIALLSCLVSTAPCVAVEDLTLTTPITYASTTKWRVIEMHLVWAPPPGIATIEAVFLDPNTGKTVGCLDTGAAALSLMSTLNTANLTANSLHKRTLNWAVGKGCIGAGAIGGTPQ